MPDDIPSPILTSVQLPNQSGTQSVYYKMVKPITARSLCRVFPEIHELFIKSVHNKKVEEVEQWLEMPVDPDAFGALTYAARQNFLEIARLLLQYRADPNKSWLNDTDTPLFWAARDQQQEMIQLLIQYGAEPNWPLWEARMNDVRIIESMKAAITQAQEALVKNTSQPPPSRSGLVGAYNSGCRLR